MLRDQYVKHGCADLALTPYQFSEDCWTLLSQLEDYIDSLNPCNSRRIHPVIDSLDLTAVMMVDALTFPTCELSSHNLDSMQLSVQDVW